ncbi:hypothetical protein [Bailinhaonella thermotolerans]|uniref:Uncharacterized protein n=1 Tax=Bailinhaonella thermotolerans TaxID=1070861 RepID=A0A3A4A4E1_9ACTN|nr:hypothetical protein [Bailinhaonella thermotolerans]RJL23626.1 hypothetical protein D5H75_32530 [Bailinhaonella thermotolerans]
MGKRLHPTDWFALLCGVMFIGIGWRYAAGPEPDPLVILPVLLVGLGFAGLLAIIAKLVRKR